MTLKVYCRVKDNPIHCKKLSDNITNLCIPYKNKEFKFNLHDVFQNINNQDIFKKLINKKQSLINYWILFGYTGTGKTYTTNGLLYQLLNYYKKNIKVSAIQIYNNDIYDLFTNQKLKFFKTLKLVIKNKTIKNIQCENDINLFLKLLKKNRAQNNTDYNSVSSRSHAIINIYVDNKEYIIVDMAGQESGVNYKNKLIQKEGTTNNLNMLALKECIRSFYNKDTYIPYRRTLITFALKSIFNINNNTSFICTVSGNMCMYNQIDSLKYANQLFECCSNENTIDYNEFLKDYNNYIVDSGWYNSNDIKLWREIKKKNFNNIKNIHKNLEKKIKLLYKFKNILTKYQKINPELIDI